MKFLAIIYKCTKKKSTLGVPRVVCSNCVHVALSISKF